MGKFDGILICTDLDGTLLREDKTVSEENLAAIEYFKGEGGYFTFVTGRLPFYSGDICRLVKPNVPFGCTNGGGLYDYDRQCYLWQQPLAENVRELVKCVEEQVPQVGIRVNSFEKSYFCRDNETLKKARLRSNLPGRFCSVFEIAEPMAKVTFVCEDESAINQVRALLEAHPLAEDFVFVRSEETLFEIIPKGIGKGMAVRKLTELLQLDPAKTVAVGDYHNDIPMFKAAGVAIAVGNACPEVIAKADFVTVHHEEHAIAKVIHDLEEGTYGI